MHWAPWTFDAAILVLQASVAIYAVIWLALSLSLKEWMPHGLVLTVSVAFHQWMSGSSFAPATPWLHLAEQLLLFALFIASYGWIFQRLSCGTLGQQLFGRASRRAPPHRAARNCLSLVLHQILAQLLLMWRFPL
jgi:hypothetical protein